MVFIKNMLFQAIFQSKSKSSHLLVVVFLCILDGLELYLTPRQPTGGGGGDSHREFFLLPIGRLGVVYDSQPHGYILFYSHPD
jgi:hypothetical protein